MNIKTLRMRAGLSQVELSNIMGVTQPTVSEWEHKKKLPAGDKLPKLAKVLNCTIDDLYGREE